MRRRIIIFAVLLLTGGATLLAARLASLLPPFGAEKEEATQETKPASKPDAATAAAKEALAALEEMKAAKEKGIPADPSKPELDISRISPNGSSVFAGRAAPNSYVTVYENNSPVGSVKADENGEWSIVTEHRFASLEPNLAFKSAAEPPLDANKPAEVAAAKGADGKPAGASASPETVAKQLMSGFEKLVAEAREEAKTEAANPPAAIEAKPDTTTPGSAPSASPAASPPSAEVAVSDASKANDAGAASKTQSPATAQAPASTAATVAAGAAQGSLGVQGSASIPVPIMFVYNEAKFTDEGRRAVDLLLEYLKLKHLASISLSGHADERGSDPYNLDLSRERLDAVAHYLREGGFAGQLDLVPKGKSEPFSGIDRTKFSGEALYQLDRRVELRVYR